MNWFESLIFGLFSGISEFLPVSSPAHQQIMLQLFGVDERDPVRDLFIHTAMLLAVILSCKPFLDLVKRERSANYSRRNATTNMRTFYDWRLVRGMLLPMVIGTFLLRFLCSPSESLLITALFIAINGVILFLPERMVQGNKDARSMTKLDSILIGSAASVSVFTGISRIGCTYSVSVARGADKKPALLWSLILSIWALAILIIFDFASLFTMPVDFWSNFHTYILSGITAYLGSYLGIFIMRFFARASHTGFAYYCWGASLFCFILYLTVS